MALKVELKPGERFIIGDSVITNGDHRASLAIEGDAPILREKDIMRPQEADTPCKKIYLSVQLMYLSRALEPHKDTYLQLTRDVGSAAPSTVPFLEEINNLILTGAYYKALREVKALIAHERDLLDHAKCR